MKTILTCAFLFFFSINGISQEFWKELNIPDNTKIASLAIDLKNNIYIGLFEYKGVYLSNDQSITWQQIGLKDIGVLSLYIDKNGYIYAGVNRFNSLYRMKNIHEGWEPLLSGIGNITTIINTLSNDLLVGGWAVIYKSSDFGKNWKEVFLLDTGGMVVNALIENDEGVLFAGITSFFGGGGVYRSVDDGNTWEYAGLLNKYISSLAVNSQGVIFAGSRGEGIGIYRSSDNGDTWEYLKNNIHTTSIVISPDDVIYAGSTNEHGLQGGVFRSIDDGENWELINTGGMGKYPDVDGLSFSPDGYLYAYNRWSLFRSSETLYISNEVSEFKDSEFIVFPNPFYDKININIPYDITYSGDVEIKIYNIKGYLILKTSLPSLQNCTLNLSFLEPDIYTILIEIKGKQISKKIIKIN